MRFLCGAVAAGYAHTPRLNCLQLPAVGSRDFLSEKRLLPESVSLLRGDFARRVCDTLKSWVVTAKVPCNHFAFKKTFNCPKIILQKPYVVETQFLQCHHTIHSYHGPCIRQQVALEWPSKFCGHDSQAGSLHFCFNSSTLLQETKTNSKIYFMGWWFHYIGSCLNHRLGRNLPLG